MSSHPTRSRLFTERLCQVWILQPGLVVIAMILTLAAIPVLVHALASNDNRSGQDYIGTEKPELAGLSASVSLSALGRGNPTINLGDGHNLITSYVGREGLRIALEQNQAQPLSLASADFDEDGVPDLVSGYAYNGLGIITLLRGNVDAIYPEAPEAQERKANGTFTDAPFLSPGQVYGAPATADFVGTGDFDGDGHWDVVVASKARNALFLFSGDGKGGLAAPKEVSLPGFVTAMTTGEINRPDGLTDIVVGVEGHGGPSLLAFEGPNGALTCDPESFALSAPVSSLALAQLDFETGLDIAAAVGSELVVIHGRDRRLSLGEERQAEVAPAVVEIRGFSLPIKAISSGDFKGERQTCLALLFEDGAVYLLSRSEVKETNARRRKISQWKSARLDSGTWRTGTRLVAARVSGNPQDDLLIVDGSNRQLHLLAGDKLLPVSKGFEEDIGGPEAKSHLVSLDMDDTPIAVLPMRLNTDALSDLVFVNKGSCNPAVALTAASGDAVTVTPALPSILFVNGTNPGRGDGNPAEAARQKKVKAKPAGAATKPVTKSHLKMSAPLLTTACPVTPIAFNQTLSGTLSATDCVLADGSFVDTYTFQALIGQQIAIGMTSNDFDTYLNLLAPDGSLLAIDDDGFGGTNSRIPQSVGFITLPLSGTYTIYANSFEGETGNYLLALVANGTGCQTSPISFNQPVSGTLASSDCPLPNGTLGDLYTFNGLAGQQVAMVMVSNDFDPILYLVRPDGTVIARDDEGAGGRNSRIPKEAGLFILPANGTYTLAASSFTAGRTGAYQIQINLDTVGCTVTTINYGQTVSGTLSEADCHLANNSFVDVYAFSGRAGQQIALTMSSSSFDTFLHLLAPDGSTLAVDDDGGGSGNSRIPPGSGVLTLPATGAYTIFANSFGPFATGNYTLTLSIAITSTTVTNTNDSGTGSLRQAILNANDNPGADTITFSIGTGQRTITPLSPLPTIIGSVTINGASQPGFVGSPLIELNGVIAGGEAYGLKIIAASCVVRGLIINRFSVDGIILSENGNDIIEGNYLGTNAAGTSALGNLRNGVAIECSNNTIGGTTTSARNVISGNGVHGIAIATSTGDQPVGNRLQGNYIGTNALGNARVGNGGNGVFIFTGSNSTIGGTTAGARNVISGNNSAGIVLGLTDPNGNLIQANYIGTNPSGTSALSNQEGVLIGGFLSGTPVIASHNTIGGTTPAARNVIAGNNGTGIEVLNTGSIENVIQGNFIGTTVNGTTVLPNAGNGILVLLAPNNTIGGTTSGAGNVIAASGVHGIGIGIPRVNPITNQPISGGKGIDVLGNFVGTDISGSIHMGNTVDGLLVAADSVSNKISGNTIAFNNRTGVNIPDLTPGAPPNSIPGVKINLDANNIYNNALLGIDLGVAGITSNDALDTDAGANLQQNFPVLTSFTSSAIKHDDNPSVTKVETEKPLLPSAAVTVRATLNSTPNSNFTVHWYFSADAQCVTNQASSQVLDKGKIPGITTDGNGNASFDFPFNFPGDKTNGIINCTATDSLGNTSEFSACLVVNAATPQWQPVVLTAQQIAQIKAWTVGGRTYVYVKPQFPDAGYRVVNWSQPVRSVNDFTVDAGVERFTGPSIQSVVTTAQIYDLGPLAVGTYNFNFKTSGTLAKTLQFTVSSATPPPNPIDNAREFVKQQYRDFLNREADQAGEDFWTDNITKCSDPARRPAGQTVEQCTVRQRETTSGAFFLSPEFQYTGYYVYRMYQGGLGRQPKLSEFTPDAQFVGAGILVNSQLSGAKINQNKADFAQQFVNCTDAAKYRCAEFKAIYDGLNNQQYVDKLFQTTAVNASASDRAALVNGLNANPATETRASVLQKVVDGIVVIAEGNQQFTTTYGQAFYNSESNRAFVQLEYFGYMKRDPDDAGYAFWLGKLNQFGGNFVNAEMVLAFISSPEYRARFGQP